MLRIETAQEGASRLIVSLTGNLTAEELPQVVEVLTRALRGGRRPTLDLSGVSLLDRTSVRFLARGPGRRARLINVPPYLMEWLRCEALEPPTSEEEGKKK